MPVATESRSNCADQGGVGVEFGQQYIGVRTATTVHQRLQPRQRTAIQMRHRGGQRFRACEVKALEQVEAEPLREREIVCGFDFLADQQPVRAQHRIGQARQFRRGRQAGNPP
ncbi:hypothetical protein ACTMU2_00985 [Cupriavidus basilensis]